MDSGIEEYTEDEIREKAQEEFKSLLEEYSNKIEKRNKELDELGILPHLDGTNHHKDIEDEFKAKVEDIKKKYGKKSSKK